MPRVIPIARNTDHKFEMLSIKVLFIFFPISAFFILFNFHLSFSFFSLSPRLGTVCSSLTWPLVPPWNSKEATPPGIRTSFTHTTTRFLFWSTGLRISITLIVDPDPSLHSNTDPDPNLRPLVNTKQTLHSSLLSHSKAL